MSSASGKGKAGRSHKARQKERTQDKADSVDVADVAKQSDGADVRGAAQDATGSKSTPDTSIQRIVDDILVVTSEIHELRAELRAKGIPPRTARTIVELGIQNQTDKLQSMMSSALDLSRDAEGSFSIEADELEHHIETLIDKERDLVAVRESARQQGLNIKVLNFLTQTLEQNPGDQGASVIRTLLEYATACGIELGSPVQEGAGPAKRVSVIPDIKRPDPAAAGRGRVRSLGADILLGTVIGIGIMWLVI